MGRKAPNNPYQGMAADAGCFVFHFLSHFSRRDGTFAFDEEEIMMNRFCQSCGMPMKKDPQNGGTNADGSKSAEYCSYCYKDGAFSSPEIDTPQKMQKFCIGKMKGMGMPGFVAWIFTRRIPKLKRWKEE